MASLFQDISDYIVQAGRGTNALVLSLLEESRLTSEDLDAAQKVREFFSCRSHVSADLAFTSVVRHRSSIAPEHSGNSDNNTTCIFYINNSFGSVEISHSGETSVESSSWGFLGENSGNHIANKFNNSKSCSCTGESKYDMVNCSCSGDNGFIFSPTAWSGH